MKKIVLVFMFLSSFMFASQKDSWLDSCFYNVGFAFYLIKDYDKNQRIFTDKQVKYMCKNALRYRVLDINKKKELKYYIIMQDDNKLNSNQINILKKHIEQDLLRYFSTPAFPKKVREAGKNEVSDFIFTIKIMEANFEYYLGLVITQFDNLLFNLYKKTSILITDKSLRTLKNSITEQIKIYSQGFYEVLNER